MLKDFYVFVDLEKVNVKPIRDVICDYCGTLLYDEEELIKPEPFYAFFYEIEEGDIVFSRIFCKECKEIKNYTAEREIIETDFENAPSDFKRDIVKCLTSSIVFEISAKKILKNMGRGYDVPYFEKLLNEDFGVLFFYKDEIILVSPKEIAKNKYDYKGDYVMIKISKEKVETVAGFWDYGACDETMGCEFESLKEAYEKNLFNCF